MKYKELVQPGARLETVKQIRDGASLDQARRDVQTFVISDRMASLLSSTIFPNLQFDTPRDQKALLVVANYGTGKTHLMSVVAAVAEHVDLQADLARADVRQSASTIVGKFAVIRFDIGSSGMSLRDIVCTELSRGLARVGVEFTFPSWEQTTNTKDALADMMAAFEAVHPGKGLLFVLDEMLDFLRARRDTQLIQDLIFLREIGEVCRSTRFRFISGVQEAIFDNPRFRGVGDALQRVRDRFEQVRITREDVAFVVEERLLRKTAAQREWIRSHLQRFAPLYSGMAERMERFVALFPVHPDYLRTFEQVSIVEKREVLRTIEREMDRLADTEVPTDSPGLLCSDSYRARLADDPSFRTIPEVQEVMDKSEVLRAKVASALPERQYVPTALRIIDGLSVQRLTTDDIHSPLGMTPEMLRDELCLLPPGLPKLDAVFLATTVHSLIDKVIRAVSGQFLSINSDNGQVYLDVRKDIDYDQRIEERAASLEPGDLDDAYYQAMEEVLKLREAPYVSGYRIWLYELAWPSHQADRAGYLFMGAPNERSTAQPPRDFYVYFLQPYERPRFEDECKPDEVFVALSSRPEFERELRRYAGARTLARESTATHRPIYEEKARTAHQGMVAWLLTHIGQAMTVTHQGQARTFAAWLAEAPGSRNDVADQVKAVAAHALQGHFEARYPGYPAFGVRVTRDNLESTVKATLTQIATQRPTTQGTKVLESLELVGLNSVELRADGPFAASLLESLAAKGGQVVNRSELLVQRDRDVWSWAPWHLEPAWLVVVAAALCQQGRLEIGIAGTRIGALGLDRLARLNLDELASFDYIAPPHSVRVAELRALARLVGDPEGAVPPSGADETLVRELLTHANELLTRANEAVRVLGSRAQIWGEVLFDRTEERVGRLAKTQTLLGDVRNRNSPGKMNSFSPDEGLLAAAEAGRQELEHVEAVLVARDALATAAEYLREAVGVFGPDGPEQQEAEQLRAEMLACVRTNGPIDPHRVVELRRAGEELRARFADLAAAAYRHDHLDARGDQAKRALLQGERYQALSALLPVTLLGAGRFAELQRALVGIPTLMEIDERKLAASVIYPGLAYRPSRPEGPSAEARLEDCQRRTQGLYDEWVATLLDSLREPEMMEQIALLDPTPRVRVEAFLSSGRLEHPVSPEFVQALNQVFARFQIRRFSSEEVWRALFPDTAPATAASLRERFESFLDAQVGAASAEQVRILPAENEHR